MHITIVGIGAMGSIYAGFLARGGHSITAIDPWHEHLDKIKYSGLRLTGYSKDILQKGIATQDPSEPVGNTDLFIIATKAVSLIQVGHVIAPLANKTKVPIVTIQNGLGAYDLLRYSVTSENIIIGIAEGFGAHIQHPGEVHHTAMRRIRLGSINKFSQQYLNQIVSVFNDAGLPAERCNCIETLTWEKFIINVALSATCALSGLTVAELLKNPDLWQLALECGNEAYIAAKALGINLSYEDPVLVITEFAKSVGAARPSMAIDFLNHRPCEIDSINGRVEKQAAKTKTPSPC